MKVLNEKINLYQQLDKIPYDKEAIEITLSDYFGLPVNASDEYCDGTFLINNKYYFQIGCALDGFGCFTSHYEEEFFNSLMYKIKELIKNNPEYISQSLIEDELKLASI